MLVIDLFLISGLGIILSTAGMYLLFKPKQSVSVQDATVDSIVGTILLHVILVCMTTKHLGALLLLLGIGMGIGLYIALYDAIILYISEIGNR